MVSRLFGAGDLDLKTDREAYWLGDSVRVTVTLACAKDQSVEGGYVELSCAGEYKIKVRRRVNNQVTIQEVTRKVDYEKARADFLPKSSVAGGAPQVFEVSIVIAPDMPPTYQGSVFRIRWQLKGAAASYRCLYPRRSLPREKPSRPRFAWSQSRSSAHTRSGQSSCARNLLVPLI
ncbi:MAG: hypothetical protein NTU41_02390 [Chloroflexi bacterium]|nr:hypothetical protein [Chloroflexota bacterium]